MVNALFPQLKNVLCLVFSLKTLKGIERFGKSRFLRRRSKFTESLIVREGFLQFPNAC